MINNKKRSPTPLPECEVTAEGVPEKKPLKNTISAALCGYHL